MSEMTNGRTGVLKQKKNQWETQQKELMASMFLDPKISYADCVKASIDADRQNHRMSRINHRFRCFRNDGIYQLNEAIKGVFGAVVSNEEKGPSVGDQTVNMVDIELADGTRTKAPYGDISLETLGEGSMISINYDSNTHELIVTGKCQQMYMTIMDDIVEETKKRLANNSIYKNQAIEISDLNDPKILNLDHIDNQLMVLSKKTQYSLRPIYARIRRPEECIAKGIALKYGTLMSGGYGTGKTLLAFKLAKEAIQNGWMFIYLKDPALLAETLRMAKTVDRSGHGVVLFLEDVDQVVRGDRDAAMQDILNTLDGGDTKDMNVISIFTTNHIELIEPTFLRGKRISSIITLGALDEETADVFVRQSMNQVDANGEPIYVIPDDIRDACKVVAENNIVPAFMADIIENIKTSMIIENEHVLKPEYIEFEVKQHMEHVALSKTKDMSETPEKKYVNSEKEALGINALTAVVGAIEGKVNELIELHE